MGEGEGGLTYRKLLWGGIFVSVLLVAMLVKGAWLIYADGQKKPIPKEFRAALQVVPEYVASARQNDTEENRAKLREAGRSVQEVMDRLYGSRKVSLHPWPLWGGEPDLDAAADKIAFTAVRFKKYRVIDYTKMDIYLIDLHKMALIQLTADSRYDSSPKVSPAGRFVAYLNDSAGDSPELMVVKADGSSLARVASGVAADFQWRGEQELHFRVEPASSGRTAGKGGGRTMIARLSSSGKVIELRDAPGY